MALFLFLFLGSKPDSILALQLGIAALEKGKNNKWSPYSIPSGIADFGY